MDEKPPGAELNLEAFDVNQCRRDRGRGERSPESNQINFLKKYL